MLIIIRSSFSVDNWSVLEPYTILAFVQWFTSFRAYLINVRFCVSIFAVVLI